MGKLSKLAFLSTYGTDKHREGIDAKVEHIVKTLPDHNTDATEEDPFKDSRMDISHSPLIKSHHIDHLLDHPDPAIRSVAAAHKNIQPHHVEHLMAKGDSATYHSLVNSKHAKLSADHIHQILDHVPPNGGRHHPASTIGYHDTSSRLGLDDSHWDKIARHPTNVAINGVGSGVMPMKHLLTAAFHNPDSYVRSQATHQHFSRHAKGESE